LTRFGIKEGVLVLLLSAVLVVLFLKSHQTSHETLYRVTSWLQEISETDSAMERDVLRLKEGLLQHYDSLARGSEKLDRILHRLKPYMETIPELAPHLAALERSVLVQKSSLDRFKRNNAIFRNSLRYFSVATSDAAEGRPELTPLLTHIHTELLRSVAVPERVNLKHLEGYVDELEQQGLLLLAKHLRLIIRSDEGLRAGMQAFIHCGIDENNEALLLAYERYHDSRMKISERYRLAMFLFSALLVLYAGLIMYRLQQAATELREANAELQYQKFALDEHAIVAVTDQKGDITYANQKFCEISGYTQQELLGQNHRILKSGYHSDAFYRQIWRTISAGKTWHGEVKNRRKDGTFYWVASSIVPFLNAKGVPYKYVAIRTDITARKEIEETQKKLSAAFYYAAEGLMITDAYGMIEHVNPAFEEMTGYSDAEIQGESATILRSSRHGEKVYDDIVETLGRGVVWKGEVPLLCKDRSEKSTLRSIAPVFNEAGDVINHVIFMKDVTEENLLRSRIEHSQRLESLGVMAGGIAHDFNNILTSIMGNAKLAEAKMRDGDSGASPYLERIAKASERAADLCRQMLAYSGQGNFQVRPVNLAELVHEIAAILELSVAENITIHYHLGKQLPSIEADTGQLQQVVMNLITNAGEAYGDERGDIRVDVGKMVVKREWLSRCVLGEALKEGDYVYLEVKDHGCGMNEETLERVFEPFFTTKFTGRGLGMSAMMGIVKAHHGAMHIYSESGTGTMIRVAFPAVDKSAEPLEHDFSLPVEYSQACIMVVDDEADILELAKAILTDLGHAVITATSGEEALEMFRREERRIDMVITDATMPGMSGDQLCQQLHALDRDVKLILSSGYDVDHATEGMQTGLLSGFIQKPYSPEKFAHEVLNILS